MTDDPDKDSSALSKLDDLDRRLKAIERKKPSEDTHAQNEAGAGKGYQALGELLGGIFIGLGAGWLSDTYLHTKPWGTIVGVLVGMFVGVYAVARSARSGTKDDPPSE